MKLRRELIAVALEWEARFGVAPAITSAVSELDAALIVGAAPSTSGRSAVARGFDFVHGGLRYQVKANRPSGRPGSRVTMVARARNHEFDRLIWILCEREFNPLEAWEWTVDEYRREFDGRTRLSPADMRRGRRLGTSAP